MRYEPAGVCRVNPNLYEEGRVCLSLLGTWTGHRQEMWTTDSNCLQVRDGLGDESVGFRTAVIIVAFREGCDKSSRINILLCSWWCPSRG